MILPLLEQKDSFGSSFYAAFLDVPNEIEAPGSVVSIIIVAALIVVVVTHRHHRCRGVQDHHY